MKKSIFLFVLVVAGIHGFARVKTTPPAQNTLQTVVLKIDTIYQCDPAVTQCTIPVWISQADNVGAITIGIQFDTTQGQMLPPVSVNPILSQIGMFMSATIQVPGTPYKEFRAIWYSNGITSLSLPETTLLFSLNFNLTADQCNFIFSIPVSNVANFDGIVVASQLVNGMASRNGCHTLSGDLRYVNAAQSPMQNIPISLWAGNQLMYETTTDQAGHFSFSSVDPGPYTVKVNCLSPTGGINSADALLVARHFVGLITLTGLSLQAAETDQSPGINASDAFLILKYFSGFTGGFPTGLCHIFPAAVTMPENNSILVPVSIIYTGDVNCSYTPEP